MIAYYGVLRHCVPNVSEEKIWLQKNDKWMSDINCCYLLPVFKCVKKLKRPEFNRIKHLGVYLVKLMELGA
jgi:hypothetical protein